MAQPRLVCDAMPHVLRICKGRDVSGLFDSVDSFEAFARDHGPGRYDVDEHSLDPIRWSAS